ncbi:MAG: hypothetical protein J6386_06045 [Candidatus Synoicihabitans palmerolidicus]|nr:hypothetical protein [Candidatus Synoicihabitans palmerolidicus]
MGWDATRRFERLSLVVQNRRFLLLTKRGEEPNLASQVLAAAVRTLLRWTPSVGQVGRIYSYGFWFF